MAVYKIGEVIDNGVNTDSQVYKKYKDIIKEEGIKEMEGKSGMNIGIGEIATLNILSPNGNQDKDNPKDTNGASIVSRLTFGENSFLFTGDMATEGETALIGKNAILNSRVLKVAHHGSKYATSEEFLNYVKPEEAVISVGKNNRYGHPAEETLARLKVHNIIVKRTDETGDMEYNF